MFCLFLDTEVSGLTPEYEILEIGAILSKYEGGKLHVVSHFQSLIKPQNGIPDNIQRLTGLKPADFIEAQSESEIRIMWEKWLQNEIVDLSQDIVIIGHSIAFDLSFLQVHRFWLPDIKPNLSSTLSKGYGRALTVPACDTLELAKIFLPDQNTLNLEYLIESLGLKSKIDEIISELSQIEDESIAASSHRALYDTCGSLALFNFILSRVEQLNLPLSLLIFLKERRLLPIYPIKSMELPLIGLNLDGLTQKHIQLSENNSNLLKESHPKQNNPDSTTSKPDETDLFNQDNSTYTGSTDPIHKHNQITYTTLNLNGDELSHDTVQKIIQTDWNNIDLKYYIENVTLPAEIRLILCQIYVFLATTRLDIKPLKIHVYGILDKHNLSATIDFLVNLNNLSETFSKDDNHNFLIPEFEKLLININIITEEEFDLTNFSQFFDLYSQTWENKIGSQFNLKTNQDLDFLAARFEHFFNVAQKKEVWIYPTSYDRELQDLTKQFKIIMKQLDEFNIESQPGIGLDNFLDHLQLKISNEIARFKQMEWFETPFIIKHSKYGIKISRINKSFNWDKYWNKLSLVPGLKLGTFLDKEHWQKLGNLINMPDEIFDMPKDLVYSQRLNVEQINLDNGLEENLEELCMDLKPDVIHLILGGQNASLERSRDILVKKLSPNQFIALGETGSLTKVIGKLRQGFTGVAVLKTADIGLLRQLTKLKFNSTAIIAQPPYMMINQFWKQTLSNQGGDFTENVIKPLRSIYLNSIIGQLSILGISKVKYLPEIKPADSINSDPILG